MIQINSSSPVDFPNGKETEIESFANLILINCPKFEMFSLNEVIDKLNLEKTKERQFNSINLEVTSLLKEYDLIKNVENTSGFFKLSQNGLLAKDKGGYFKYVEFIKNKELESNNKTTINNFNNNTIGQFIQDSDLKNLTIEIKHKSQPIAKEKQHKAIISFISKFWWQILIPVSIVLFGILVERKIIDIGI